MTSAADMFGVNGLVVIAVVPVAGGWASTVVAVLAVAADVEFEGLVALPELVALVLVEEVGAGSASQLDPAPPSEPAIWRCCCSIIVTQ